MACFDFMWDEENIRKLHDNYVDQDEAEDVVEQPEFTIKAENGTIEAYGYAETGKYISVIYVLIDPVTVYVVTAFKPTSTRRRKRKPRGK